MSADDLRRGLARGNLDALRMILRAHGPLHIPWDILRDGPTGHVTTEGGPDGVEYRWGPDLIERDEDVPPLDLVAQLVQAWTRTRDVLHEQASGLAEKAEELRSRDFEPLRSGDDPMAVAEEIATKLDRQVGEKRAAAHAYSACAVALSAWLGDARWRDLAHSQPAPGDAAAMDTITLADRLESLARLLRSINCEVSWLHLDPTNDGPDEPETVHTLELAGANAAEVLGNLDALVSSMSSVRHIVAEATPGRVLIEAQGVTEAAGSVRGSAVILEPYASPLQVALDIVPVEGQSSRLRFDLTLTLIETLAADSQMQAGVTNPEPPAVDVAPAPDPEVPSSTPSTDPTSPTPSPTTADAPPSEASSSSPGTPSTPSPDASPTSPDGSPADATAGATSETPGGSTTPPGSGTSAPAPADGGLSVSSSADVPQGSSPAPAPDPVSTTPTPREAGGTATGQQPGTPDGAAVNADGTPTEPTAGTTADVGTQDSSATPSEPSNLPGQTPVAVSSEPLDTTPADPSNSGAVSTAPTPSDPTGPAATSDTATSGRGDNSRASRIAQLENELAELRAAGGDGGTATVESSGGEVQVAANVDPVPDGGQNLASGQGGGAASAAPDSGDGSATAPSGAASAEGNTNPDGF